MLASYVFYLPAVLQFSSTQTKFHPCKQRSICGVSEECCGASKPVLQIMEAVEVLHPQVAVQVVTPVPLERCPMMLEEFMDNVEEFPTFLAQMPMDPQTGHLGGTIDPG